MLLAKEFISFIFWLLFFTAPNYGKKMSKKELNKLLDVLKTQSMQISLDNALMMAKIGELEKEMTAMNTTTIELGDRVQRLEIIVEDNVMFNVRQLEKLVKQQGKDIEKLKEQLNNDGQPSIPVVEPPAPRSPPLALPPDNKPGIITPPTPSQTEHTHTENIPTEDPAKEGEGLTNTPALPIATEKKPDDNIPRAPPEQEGNGLTIKPALPTETENKPDENIPTAPPEQEEEHAPPLTGANSPSVNPSLALPPNGKSPTKPPPVSKQTEKKPSENIPTAPAGQEGNNLVITPVEGTQKESKPDENIPTAPSHLEGNLPVNSPPVKEQTDVTITEKIPTAPSDQEGNNINNVS